ncbi:uncharacterized protein A4U43_C10F7910 [Asparagus officinalis]|uniref:Uncharacterized protein n=1 Tax=Asparagus officinalis TaxID=4686 RepID=A0A5P1E344_ASPOF|nr:uncharacterized protein A4U43_C10F7910 [Asparagus officinalis]
MSASQEEQGRSGVGPAGDGGGARRQTAAERGRVVAGGEALFGGVEPRESQAPAAGSGVRPAEEGQEATSAGSRGWSRFGRGEEEDMGEFYRMEPIYWGHGDRIVSESELDKWMHGGHVEVFSL